MGAEAVGVILTVGVTLAMLPGALWVLSWCSLCEEQAPPLQHGGAWDNCELHGSDHMPQCSRHTGTFLREDGTPECHIIHVKTYAGHGVIKTVDQLVCEVLKTTEKTTSTLTT